MRQKTNILALLTLILFGFFTLSSLLMAHETQHTTQSAPAGKANPPGQAVTSADQEEESEGHNAASEAPRPVPMPFSTSMKDHLHNKIVHFPVALGIVGSLFVLISLRKPEMLTAARILWFLAAATAVGAYFSGHLQEGPFESGAMHNIFEVHETLGTVTAIALWVGFFLTLIRRLRGLNILWAIIVLLLASVTGYYGGLLAAF